MKLIALTLIFLFTAIFSFAQRFEIGSAIGLGYTKPVSGWPTEHPFSNTERTVGGLSGYMQPIEVAYNIGRYQFGMALNYTALIYYWGNYETASNGKMFFAKNMSELIGGLPIKILANRVFTVRKFQFYGGLSAGFVNDRAETRSAWTGGLQLGGTWWFVKHCGLNINAAADYYNVHYNGSIPDGTPSFDPNAAALNFPLTVGLRYSFLK